MRAGLVGVGRWGRHIVRDLVTLGCEVHAVAQSGASPEKAMAGDAAFVTHPLDEMPTIDGVVVATQTSAHPEVVSRGVDFGVHIAELRFLAGI